MRYAIGLSASLLVFYFLIEPWLLRKQKDIHHFLSIAIMGGLLAVGLNALAIADWHMPTSIMDFLTQLIFLRVVGETHEIPNVHSHAIAMFSMVLLTPFIYWREKDGLKGALMNYTLAFWGESIWMVFYSHVYWAQIDWVTEGPQVCSLILFVSSSTLIYLIKYKPSKLIALVPIEIASFEVYWLLFQNFSITVVSHLKDIPIARATVWYSDPLTNFMEVVATPIQVLLFAYLATRGTPHKGLNELYGVQYNPFGMRKP